MSLPKTFKRAVFKEKDAPLVVEETELKAPGKGEVLVKVEACGVCYSDHFAQIGFGGLFPIVPGHEIIGNVAAVGENVTTWKVGDRIGGPWHGGHDGTCNLCAKGLFQMCPNNAVNGVTKDGGYAEYVLLRAEAGVRIPKDVDGPKYAPILCAGVTVFNAMRKSGVPAGSTVAIQGLGGLGHLGLQFANKFGYRVVALSRDNKKEKFARDLGAHEYIDGSKGDVGKQLQELGGADMVVCTAPNPEQIPSLIAGLNALGKLVILPVIGEVKVDTAALVTKGISVTAWPSGQQLDSEETIAYTKLQNIDCMIEKFPLDKAADAYKSMSDGKVRFRAVICP